VQLTKDQLLAAADRVNLELRALLNLFKNQKITDQDFTTLYLLLFLRIKHPKNYLQQNKKFASDSKTKTLLDIIPVEFNLSEDEKNKLKNISGEDLFLNFNLRGIPASINRAMINWYQNKWNIVLSFKIPGPNELLMLQTENKRILTLIVDEKRITTHLFEKRDPLSFALHDLMHADQFFNNPISQKGQLGFYQFISSQIKLPELVNLMETNPSFKIDFEYVVSDMNAYIIHLLKSFKSCFSKAEAPLVLNKILTESKTPPHITDLIMSLNQAELTLQNELIIKNYFESIQDYVK
jgi:hypothetical protein